MLYVSKIISSQVCNSPSDLCRCENCGTGLTLGKELVHADLPYCEGCHLKLFGSSWNKFSTDGKADKVTKSKKVTEEVEKDDLVSGLDQEMLDALDPEDIALLRSLEMDSSAQLSPVEKAGLGKGEVCIVCDKAVYFAEQLKKAEGVYHKNCYRCDGCDQVLKLGDDIEANQGYYCSRCYKRKFGPKVYGFGGGDNL